jgi:amino acid transporter
MHFPGGVVLLLISSAALHAHCLVGFIKSRLRNALNTTISIIGTVWFLTILGGVFFNNGYPYNKNAIVIYLGIVLIYFTIYYLLIKRKENKADTI